MFNETEPSKDYLQPWSSSISDDANCTEDVINRNLPVRVLDLYSDDRSDDTSRVCKEQAAINISSVSPEITSDSLSESNANSKPVVDSGGPEVPPPRLISEKTVRDWVFDPRLYIVSALLLVRLLDVLGQSSFSCLGYCHDHQTNQEILMNQFLSKKRVSACFDVFDPILMTHTMFLTR